MCYVVPSSTGVSLSFIMVILRPISTYTSVAKLEVEP